MRQAEVSQSVVPGPVESALPRNVLEMENLGPQLKPSGSATLELGTELRSPEQASPFRGKLEFALSLNTSLSTC